jgi:hypothetical protein
MWSTLIERHRDFHSQIITNLPKNILSSLDFAIFLDCFGREFVNQPGSAFRPHARRLSTVVTMHVGQPA